MDDVARFTQAIANSTLHPKCAPGHTQHTDDCMSEWAENRRGIMTPDTVAANHRLHMGDVAMISGVERREFVARAIFGAANPIVEAFPDYWERVGDGEQTRERYRQMADAAIAAIAGGLPT